ncbi:unnamed protein product [Ectocarpus sp. CCAP 1310/34]|nr:unnamed protein product [Ectocarpus sp. CCAP 1310/34]
MRCGTSNTASDVTKYGGEEQQAWERSPRCKASGWFDPFLTRDGHLQVCRAGEHLKGLPFNRQQKQPGSFDIVRPSFFT